MCQNTELITVVHYLYDFVLLSTSIAATVKTSAEALKLVLKYCNSGVSVKSKQSASVQSKYFMF